MITPLASACQSNPPTPLSPFSMPAVIDSSPSPSQNSDSGASIVTPIDAPAVAVNSTSVAGTLRPATAQDDVITTMTAAGSVYVPPITSATEIVGYSVEGRALTAHRFGIGERILLLVGGIHGGYEANTVALIEALIAHFAATPVDVRAGITLILIPVANPDGLARGDNFEARFNGSGVDLNRNWGCGWSRDAVWRNQPVNPGGGALSEPETQALSAYILRVRPVTALFYHSAAGGVYEGDCQGTRTSQMMAAVYGEASGYSYGQPFSAYPVTGTAASWVDGIGIPSADIELFTHDDPEFDRNLRAIHALQEWIIALP